MMVDKSIRANSGNWRHDFKKDMSLVELQITKEGIEHLDKLENSSRFKITIWISSGSLLVSIVAIFISLKTTPTSQPQRQSLEIKKSTALQKPAIPTNNVKIHANKKVGKDSLKEP